jgi:hypothetical protein
VNAIKLYISVTEKKLKHVCIYNVLPTVNKYNTAENPQYPYLGSDEERKSYVLYMNQKLKEKCIENGYIFFDIYNEYIDSNGYLRKDMSDDNVHIKNGVYIDNFIKSYLS